MKPTCCGKNATPYRKVYGNPPHSWEEGFRCRRCGRVRIPGTFDRDAWLKYEAEMDALRMKAIEEEL